MPLWRCEFYEMDEYLSLKDQALFGKAEPLTKEILTLCNNKTDHHDSQVTSREEYRISVLYVSATDNVIVVLYNDVQTYFNVTLDISASNCRGAFVNPCIKYDKSYWWHGKL